MNGFSMNGYHTRQAMVYYMVVLNCFFIYIGTVQIRRMDSNGSTAPFTTFTVDAETPMSNTERSFPPRSEPSSSPPSYDDGPQYATLNSPVRSIIPNNNGISIQNQFIKAQLCTCSLEPRLPFQLLVAYSTEKWELHAIGNAGVCSYPPLDFFLMWSCECFQTCSFFLLLLLYTRYLMTAMAQYTVSPNNKAKR